MQHRFRLRIAHSRPGVDGRVRAQRPAPLFLPFRNSDPWDPAAKQWWLAAAPAHAAVLGALAVEDPTRHAGDIAARPVEISHETACNWIAAADEHDRYGRGGSAGRPHGDIWADDHGHLPARQIRRECRQPIELVLRPAKFDRDVVAVDEPGFLQAVAECRYPVNGIGSRGGIKETDHRHCRLLRAHREWPRCRAAERG